MDPTESYIDAMISKGDLALKERQIEVAILRYQMCILMLESIGTASMDYRFMHIYTSLAESYALDGGMVNARRIFNKAFCVTLDNRDYVQASQILLKMGLIMEEYDLDDEALQYYRTGLQILELDPADHYKEKMELYSTQGSCLYVMERDEEALQSFKKALTFARKSSLTSHDAISKLVFNIAELMKVGGFTAEALDVYETSLELDCSKYYKDQSILATMETIVRCTELYMTLLKPHDALRVATNGINLCVEETQKSGNRRLGKYYARLTFLCGVVHLRLRETKLAMELFSTFLRVSMILYQDMFVYLQFDNDSVNRVYDQLVLLSIGNDDHSFASAA